MRKILNLGSGKCLIPIDEIRYILDPSSEPLKRKLAEWKKRQDLDYVDICCGKKLRSVIVTDRTVFATNISTETLHKRLEED